MTDENATNTANADNKKAADIVDADVVDDDVVDAENADTAVVDAEIVEEPAAVATAPDDQPQQVVFLNAPAAPRKKGNRGVGTLLALLSGVVFAAVLAGATSIIGFVNSGIISFNFVTDARFYIPVLFFVVGFVLLVLIFNRAAWWAYIVGSLLLAVFVYFGTIGLGLLAQGVISNTPAEAADMYAVALRDPFVIVAALVAREVSLWMGGAIARRGRKVRARNVETQAAYDRDLAEQRAQHGRGPSAPATAV